MSEQQILSEIKDLKAMVSIPVKRWLSLKEAIEYTGKGKYTLLNWVAKGYINAFKDEEKRTSGWTLDRSSIDTYMTGRCHEDGTVQKAREILGKIK